MRLAADIPGARVEWIDEALTFVPIDATVRLAGLIRELVAATP